MENGMVCEKQKPAGMTVSRHICLGIPVTQPMGEVVPGKGKIRSNCGLRNKAKPIWLFFAPTPGI